MPISEAKFQASLITDVEIDGGVGLKIEPGTGNVPKGWPDLLLLKGHGRSIYVEVKVLNGTVTPEQRRMMRLLRMSGYECCFCDPRPDFAVPVPMTMKEIETYEPPQH